MAWARAGGSFGLLVAAPRAGQLWGEAAPGPMSPQALSTAAELGGPPPYLSLGPPPEPRQLGSGPSR